MEAIEEDAAPRPQRVDKEADSACLMIDHYGIFVINI